jgi:hypothetical protein
MDMPQATSGRTEPRGHSFSFRTRYGTLTCRVGSPRVPLASTGSYALEFLAHARAPAHQAGAAAALPVAQAQVRRRARALHEASRRRRQRFRAGVYPVPARPRHAAPAARVRMVRGARLHCFSLLGHGLAETLCLADINPEAVEACRRTIASNGLGDRAAVYHSDNLKDSGCGAVGPGREQSAALRRRHDRRPSRA